MKKILALAVMALISVGAMAQRNTFEIGGKLNYAGDDPHWGFGTFLRYNINKNFRPEFAINFYPESDDNNTEWDANFNLHYVFHISTRFKLYPLGGLAIVGNKHSWVGGSYSNTNVGVNLGGGLQYNISRNLHLNAEAFYNGVGDNYDKAVTNVSIAYVF